MPKGPFAGSRLGNDDLKTCSVVFFFGIASYVAKLEKLRRKKRNKPIMKGDWFQQVTPAYLLRIEDTHLVDGEILVQMGS